MLCRPWNCKGKGYIQGCLIKYKVVVMYVICLNILMYSGEGGGSCKCVHIDLGMSAVMCVSPYSYMCKVKNIVSVKT